MIYRITILTKCIAQGTSQRQDSADVIVHNISPWDLNWLCDKPQGAVCNQCSCNVENTGNKPEMSQSKRIELDETPVNGRNLAM